MEIYIALSILIIFFIFQLLSAVKQKSLEKFSRYSFLISSVGVVLVWVVISILQIKAWQGMGVPGIYFIPPYESFTYAFEYHFFRFFLYYLISFLAGLFFLIYAKKINKKSGGVFFEKEEPYLGAVTILLLGSTGLSFSWIYYVLAIFLLPVLITFLKKIIAGETRLHKKFWRGRNERFPLRFLWLPVGILVILINIVL